MDGWILIFRAIMNNPLYYAEKFCKQMAWIDLLLVTNYKDGSISVRGMYIDIPRGSCGYSIETLAARWKWSRGKVSRYLTHLQTKGQIILQKSNATTIITVVNYDRYQTPDTANDTANKSADGQQTDSKRTLIKNEKKENKTKTTRPAFEEVCAFCKSKNLKTNPKEFYDNYEKTHWMINNEPINDWKAVLRGWESKNKNLPNSKNPSVYLSEPDENDLAMVIETQKDIEWTAFKQKFTLGSKFLALFFEEKQLFVTWQLLMKSSRLMAYAENLFTLKEKHEYFNPASYGTHIR